MTSAAPTPAASRALQAKLFTARGRRSVRVMTMSDGEATVACRDQPPRGTFAYLVRNGVKLPAMIDWTGEDRLGLRFEAPLWTERKRETFHAVRRPSSAPAAARDTAGPATEPPATEAACATDCRSEMTSA